MFSLEQMKKVGLTGNQARVYLALVQKGPQFLQELADNTGIKRTSLYLVIDQMDTDGLIDAEIRGKRKRYYIKDPKLLLQKAREKFYFLDALVPQLEDVFERQSSGNKIRFYDTKTGLKEALKELNKLNPEKDELLTIEGDIRSAFKLGYDFWKDLLAEKKLMQIRSRTIIPSNEKDEFIIRNHKIQMRTSSLLDEFKIMLYIFSDKVMLMIPEDQLCVVIENLKIKKALAAMFEVVWKRSKSYYKN